MPEQPPIDESLRERLTWVSAVTGAVVTNCVAHPAAGHSRAMWLIDAETATGPLRMLLRQDNGFGPFSGTGFTLGREAGIVAALSDTDIPVPRVYGVDADGTMTLHELLPGDTDLAPGSPSATHAMASYVALLARLHALDPASLPLPASIGAVGADPVGSDLAEHRASYRTRCAPNQLVDQAFGWLADNAPGPPARTVLTHGDAGPGNFLHANGTVTGLIDWELSHLGDPMDDLAWLWFRIEVLGKGGDLSDAYAQYQTAAGTPIDLARVDYFCVAVVVRCLVATLVRQANSADPSTAGSVRRTSRLMQTMLANQHDRGRVGASGSLPALPSSV